MLKKKKRFQPSKPLVQNEFQDTLREIAHSMAGLKKPERLLRMMTRLIDSQWGVSHTSFAVFDASKERFHFLDSKGSEKLPLKLIRFDLDSPLVTHCQSLLRKKADSRFLYLPQVNKVKKTSAKKKLGNDPESVIARTLRDLKIELVIPGYYKKQLTGMLMLGGKKSRRCFTKAEISFFQVLTQDCCMALKHSEYQQELLQKNRELEKRLLQIEKLHAKEHETFYEILRSMAQEVYLKDAYTFGHVKQVERLGLMTAKELGLDLSGRKRDILSAGLILHDVGKIGIPDNILNKPASLDPEEWEIMKTHADKGAQILEHLTDFKEVAEIVRCHHEKVDGTGYPRGMKGKKIPIESRIVTAVDAFHAIVSTRCYSKGESVAFAFEELRRCVGTQFDGDVVEALISAVTKDMKKRGVGKFTQEIDSPSSEDLAETLSGTFALS